MTKKTQLTYADWLESLNAQAPPPGSFTIADVARDKNITYSQAEGVVIRAIRAGTIKDAGFRVDGRQAKKRYYIVVQPNGKG